MDIYYVNLVILVLSCQRTTASKIEKPHITSTKQIVGEEISWSGTQLSDIPKGNMTIQKLDLAYNHISILPPNIFQNKTYRDLTHLDMHENRISNISSLAFNGMKKLKNIDLSFNKITGLDTYTFEQSKKLEKMDLTSNMIRFTKSEVFLMSSSMRTLVLTNNDINQVYELTFIGLKHLTSLILDENILNKIHPNSFKPLIDIQFLSLANTGVMHLSATMFAQLPRVINIERSPLANRFNPPLKRIKKDQVTELLKIEDYGRLGV